ncbi:MAG: hypothetical protein MJK10_09230 [Pseudomonadales bacterium]|nr:hypothetical protein [Pseudomonadales bacterium]NRA16226.1 hypothetical protein [Oceanospirillaceae bacterium]
MANWQAISAESPALRRYVRSLLQDSDLANDRVQASLGKMRLSPISSLRALK